jgi:hypothetical protein
VLGACAPPAPPALEARVLCAAEGHPLRQACTVTLAERGTGRPVEGARLTLSADMPSMPLQHRVKPAPAAPAAAPGTYRATLELEMPGRWVVAVRVTAPVSDQFTHALDVP